MSFTHSNNFFKEPLSSWWRLIKIRIDGCMHPFYWTGWKWKWLVETSFAVLWFYTNLYKSIIFAPLLLILHDEHQGNIFKKAILCNLLHFCTTIEFLLWSLYCFTKFCLREFCSRKKLTRSSRLITNHAKSSVKISLDGRYTVDNVAHPWVACVIACAHECAWWICEYNLCVKTVYCENVGVWMSMNNTLDLRRKVNSCNMANS